MFEVTVLAPERALAEKLAFLHHRASAGDHTALRTALGICTTRPCFSVMTASKRPSPMIGSPNSWSISTSAARPPVGRSHHGPKAVSRPASRSAATTQLLRHYETVMHVLLISCGELPAFDDAIDIVRRSAHIL